MTNPPTGCAGPHRRSQVDPVTHDSSSGADKRPLTVFTVMRRPRWIALLVLALLVAAAFALLGRWQLERAVVSEAGGDAEEVAVQLSSLAEPQAPMYADQAGVLVTMRGQFGPEDFVLVANRWSEGREGYWLAGRFALADHADPTSVAVALGWTDSLDQAYTALDSAPTTYRDVEEITGRYAETEAPLPADSGAAGEKLPTTLAVAELINRWPGFGPADDVYAGYVIADTVPTGLDLETIVAGPREAAVELNWLNIFYAIEWAVFGGFAIFLWYRLARDAWERELDAAVESEHGSGTETS